MIHYPFFHIQERKPMRRKANVVPDANPDRFFNLGFLELLGTSNQPDGHDVFLFTLDPAISDEAIAWCKLDNFTPFGGTEIIHSISGRGKRFHSWILRAKRILREDVDDMSSLRSFGKKLVDYVREKSPDMIRKKRERASMAPEHKDIESPQAHVVQKKASDRIGPPDRCAMVPPAGAIQIIFSGPCLGE